MITSAQIREDIEKVIQDKLIQSFGSLNDAEAMQIYERAKERLFNWLDNTSAKVYLDNYDKYLFVFRIRSQVFPTDSGFKARYVYLDLIDESDLGYADENVNGNTIQKQDGKYGFEIWTDYVLFKDDGMLGTPSVQPKQIFRSKRRYFVSKDPVTLPEIIDDNTNVSTPQPIQSGFNLSSNMLLIGFVGLLALIMVTKK